MICGCLEGSLTGMRHPSNKTIEVASPLGLLIFQATGFVLAYSTRCEFPFLEQILNPIGRLLALSMIAEQLLHKQAHLAGILIF